MTGTRAPSEAGRANGRSLARRAATCGLVASAFFGPGAAQHRARLLDDPSGRRRCYQADYFARCAATPLDLVSKLDVLAVACDKCGRSGRSRVATIADAIGWDGRLTDCLYDLTADCARKRAASVSDPPWAGTPSDMARRGCSVLFNQAKQLLNWATI